jgi:hypothetical protein
MAWGWRKKKQQMMMMITIIIRSWDSLIKHRDTFTLLLRSSETSVNFSRTTRLHIPEFSTVIQLCKENTRDGRHFLRLFHQTSSMWRDAGLLHDCHLLEEPVPTPLAETPYRRYPSTYWLKLMARRGYNKIRVHGQSCYKNRAGFRVSWRRPG